MWRMLCLLGGLSLLLASRAPAQDPVKWSKDYVYVNGQLVAIVVPGNPSLPQPTTLSFSLTSLFAGVDCTTVTVGNGANMTVDLEWKYTPWGGGAPQTQSATFGPLDSNGQRQLCPAQSTPPGTYVYTRIKNHVRTDWAPLNPEPQVIVRPAKPTAFSFDPLTINSTESFAVTVGNGANQTIFEEVLYPDGTVKTALVSIRSDGTQVIVTDCALAPGLYVVQRIRNHLDPAADAWFVTSAPNNTLTVRRGSPCPGPVSFSPASLFAGVDCTTVTVVNGANMTVDLEWKYTPWGGGAPQTQSAAFGPLDGNGQRQLCPAQSTPPGTYVYTRIKNQLRADWVPLSPQPQVVIRPPKPTAFSVSPLSVITPQNFTVSVGNGADQTIYEEVLLQDERTLNYQSFAVCSNGTRPSCAGCNLAPGRVVVRKVRNALDSAEDAWLITSAPQNTLSITVGPSCPDGSCPGSVDCPP